MAVWYPAFWNNCGKVTWVVSKGLPLSIFPFMWLCLPVKITALEGAQIELVTDAFLSNFGLQIYLANEKNLIEDIFKSLNDNGLLCFNLITNNSFITLKKFLDMKCMKR